MRERRIKTGSRRQARGRLLRRLTRWSCRRPSGWGSTSRTFAIWRPFELTPTISWRSSGDFAAKVSAGFGPPSPTTPSPKCRSMFLRRYFGEGAWRKRRTVSKALTNRRSSCLRRQPIARQQHDQCSSNHLLRRVSVPDQPLQSFTIGRTDRNLFDLPHRRKLAGSRRFVNRASATEH